MIAWFLVEQGKSQRSRVSRASLRLSTVSRKREKLALAQLNLCQIKIRQQIEEEQYAIKEEQEIRRRRKLEKHEIRRRRELLEAEMLTEKAAVSLKVHEEETQKESRGPIFGVLGAFSTRAQKLFQHTKAHFG